MDTVMVVGAKNTAEKLLELLVPKHFSRGVYAPSAAFARRAVSQQPPALVLISAPLPDEAGDELAAYLARGTDADVILLASAETMEAGGAGEQVVVLEKPVNRQLLLQAVGILAMARQRTHKLRQENEKLTARLEEARLVGRAKCALVAYRQMTENQAHRYIEQMAMEGRQPKRSVAREILEMYEG